MASLEAEAAGEEVAHVDASKKAIGFARESVELAKLESAKIRWLCDDALAFVARGLGRVVSEGRELCAGLERY